MGAQAVGEGVEAHGGLALRSYRTGGLLRILPVCFLPFLRNYHTDFPLSTGTRTLTPISWYRAGAEKTAPGRRAVSGWLVLGGIIFETCDRRPCAYCFSLSSIRI